MSDNDISIVNETNDFIAWIPESEFSFGEHYYRQASAVFKSENDTLLVSKRSPDIWRSPDSWDVSCSVILRRRHYVDPKNPDGDLVVTFFQAIVEAMHKQLRKGNVMVEQGLLTLDLSDGKADHETIQILQLLSPDEGTIGPFECLYKGALYPYEGEPACDYNTTLISEMKALTYSEFQAFKDQPDHKLTKELVRAADVLHWAKKWPMPEEEEGSFDDLFDE